MKNRLIAAERVEELRKYDTQESPFVDQLLSGCMETAKHSCYFLHDNISSRNMKLLNSKAHLARGSCLDAGYIWLAEIFGKIEMAAAENSFVMIVSTLPELDQAIKATDAALKLLLAQNALKNSNTGQKDLSPDGLLGNIM